jgi:hypothetical protein
MTVKTIRLNNEENKLTQKLLSYYHQDFSSFVKGLIYEKLEDMQDFAEIKTIKETKPSGYKSASALDKLYN